MIEIANIMFGICIERKIGMLYIAELKRNIFLKIKINNLGTISLKTVCVTYEKQYSRCKINKNIGVCSLNNKITGLLSVIQKK